MFRLLVIILLTFSLYLNTQFLIANSKLQHSASSKVPFLPWEPHLRVIGGIPGELDPGFTTSYKARPFLRQTNKGGVSDFIYFDNPPPAREHFAVFVKVNDNNLANSLWAALNSDRQIIRGPALLIIRGEAIRGTQGGYLSLVTICQWDKGHCYV